MRYLKILIIGIFIVGCEKNDVLEGPWNVHDSDNIELYVRPAEFNNDQSPDTSDIKLILRNQNNFIDTINTRLNIHCDSKFKIYLFNYDEAKELIGTNTGGYAIPSKGELYYTFFEAPIYYPDMDIYSYLGFHELVHLVTIGEFGSTKNRMITEGYAVAVDNSYGARYGDNGEIIRMMNREWMEFYLAENLIFTPNELLNGDDLPEQQYYPQVGVFINWLFDKFGVDQINKIFNTDKEDFKQRFEDELGTKYDDLENEYLDYCNNEFK